MPHDKAYYEAEKKIQQALKSGAAELDLRSMQLTELPESIGQLKQLRELDLSWDYSDEKQKNQLTALPPSLGQLTQLTVLDLSSNQLTSLPDSLGQLTQLTSLNLSENQLTSLPPSLGQLTQLTSLNLSENQLTSLPPSLGQLTQLQTLNLSYNQLTSLPDSLGQLTQLTSLNLSENQLTSLPDSLGQLTQLQTINISNCQITTLPNWLAQLTKLRRLDLSKNNLTTLPAWIDVFSELEMLWLYGNNIVSLPDQFGNLRNLYHLGLGSASGSNPLINLPNCIRSLKNLKNLWLVACNLKILPEWLGELEKLDTLQLHENNLSDLPPSLAQLEHIEKFYLSNNPLNPALQSAYDQGPAAVKAYLRSLAEGNAEPLYEAKLVLVGEGNVGKTTLLKALKGRKDEAPQKNEPTTHGVEIDIHGLRLPHPTQDGVEIQLNAWDFGGQDVYRVTHQFFFSRRSLYLLVWEPRRGVQQCQVEDWLNMIRLRVGDEARVIIISTYSTSGEHLARIDKPVFKQQYGDMIVGFHEVDSLVLDKSTGEMVGIAELKSVIAEHAAKLEQMGMLFNNNWKAARDELIASKEPRVSYTAFGEVCAKHGLSQIDTDTLAHLMHDLGYIVHYADDEKLRDDVVLKPEWLTKAIGFVLENRATAEREGILPDGELYRVWHDHTFEGEPRYDRDVYPFFLRLMEKYDVCYRLMDGKASLVAQHVPQVRPELPWLPEQEPAASLRRIAMICAMEEDPPGLVPWMIVRTHDYAVEQKNDNGGIHRLHWQKGMFLDHGTHGTAMLEKRGREFHVYTQAEWPEYFMNVLQETLLKLIKDNWPGLEGRYGFAVPCHEVVNGQPCKGRFKIQALRQFLAEGDTNVRCQECSCRLSIAELLFGFEEPDMSVQLREIKEQLAGMDSRVANYFMTTLRAIADEGKEGPRLFTFRERAAGLSLKPFAARPLELQLWCEAEGCPHEVIESGLGVYPIDMPREWFAQIAPYASFVLKVLATVAPLAAPAIDASFGRDTAKNMDIDRQLDLAKAIIGKLPTDIKASDRDLAPGGILSGAERSGILALHQFLAKVDPTQSRMGLHRVLTYTGDYRWLCTHHYKLWQPNIPDVIPAH
jgi:internalin A